MAVAPSRIARFVASKHWPDVQSQEKVAKGAFWFSSAGHGGVVAVVGQVNVSDEALDVLREHGHTDEVCFRRGGTSMLRSEHVREQWDDYKARVAASYNEGSNVLTLMAQSDRRVEVDDFPVTFHEVIVGEEDVEWSLLFLAGGDALIGEAHTRASFKNIESERVRKTARDWYPDEYEALTGETLTADDSYELHKRKHAEDNESNYVTRAAWGDWQDGVPEGFVGVLARRESDGDEGWFLVEASEYKAGNGNHGFVVDEARHERVEDFTRRGVTV